MEPIKARSCIFFCKSSAKEAPQMYLYKSNQHTHKTKDTWDYVLASFSWQYYRHRLLPKKIAGYCCAYFIWNYCQRCWWENDARLEWQRSVIYIHTLKPSYDWHSLYSSNYTSFCFEVKFNALRLTCILCWQHNHRKTKVNVKSVF